VGVFVASGIGAQAQEVVGHADAGQSVYRKCMACHRVGPGAVNAIGPVLNGIVGRTAGTYPGYDFSDANKNSGIIWEPAILMAYLRAPQAIVPGTKMTFAGLPSDQEAADVVAYLATFDADGNTIAPAAP
jgi:cytochrome c